MSLILHTLVFVVLIVMMTRIPNGAGEVENRTGGIVLVDMKSETTEYLTQGDVEQAAAQQTAAPAAEAAQDLDLPPELPGMESSNSSAEGAAESIANGLTGVNELNLNQPVGEIGGKVTTSVFGVQGTGSRFVYVFDRSDSMNGFGSRPMIAARKQLIESLNSLQATHQFQIIFYNDTIKIFNPDGRPTMYFADDQKKKSAIRFVNATHPSGGTDHLNALNQAFKLQPDVIFMLTDAEGGFTSAELTEITNNNRSAAIINTIEFGQSRGFDRSLEAVSKTSGGQYVFKNINSLKVNADE